MKTFTRFLFLTSALTLSVTDGLAAPTGSNVASEATLRFSEKEYLHRWSKADQHEFTPRDQPDLKQWKDMVTLNYYPRATSGEGLAATANAVLENYKHHNAMVVKTSSVPRTAQKPAEHLIVVLFPRPEFIEAVFARFTLEKGTGTAVIYSHREYGNKIGDKMSVWLNQNGPIVENALMALKQYPDLSQPKG